METIGFCYIKANAKTGKGIREEDLSSFLGEVCEIQDINEIDGGMLVLNSNGTAMGMFEKEDIKTYFKCSVKDMYILPPNLTMIEQMAYMYKLATRKGGYNKIIKQMVIVASLGKGEYNDTFLFSKN